MQRTLWVINKVDFDATAQLLVIDYAFVRYLEKNGDATKQCISFS